MKMLIVVVFAATSFSTVSLAQTKSTLEVGGFADIYYGYDFSRPPSRTRSYFTQATRHGEFNVNLAYIEAKHAGEKTRGRLALQTGTSVVANYAGESAANPSTQLDYTLARMIQEAVVGYRISPDLWIDAGIFFSHIGFEGWISRDNWNYTRLIMSDYSPYYQTGVKLTYQFTPSLSGQLHVLNGWQNIYKSNDTPAVGAQIAFAPSSYFSVTYAHLTSRPSTFRIYHDLQAKMSLGESLQLGAVFDLGQQERTTGGWSTWWTAALLSRYQWSPLFGTAVRLERYQDPDQHNFTTGTANGAQINSATVGADFQFDPKIVWRNEYRIFLSQDAIFPARDGSNWANTSLVSTSLALTF